MEQSESSLETSAQKVSYGLGLQLGNQIAGQSFPGFSLDALIIGIRDVMENRPMRVAEAAMQNAFNEINNQIRNQASAAAAENKAAGTKFLADNLKRDGVKETDSGLQYEIIQEGDGPRPKATDTVVTHYHGTLIDGAVFDSSIERGQPAEFPVNGVIKGWVEALQLMTVGSKWRLFIKSDLAYGDQGAGAAIQPGSTLLFDIELLDIKG